MRQQIIPRLKGLIWKLLGNHRLAAFFIFDFVWLAAVLGRERWLWMTALLIALMFAATPKLLWRQRWSLLFLVVLGCLIELATVKFGVIRFTGTDWIPLWLILLWVGFSGMALVVFDYLNRRFVIAGLLGAIFGPITYFAGERLGAAELQINFLPALVVYSLFWCVMMVIIAAIVVPLNTTSKHGQ